MRRAGLAIGAIAAAFLLLPAVSVASEWEEINHEDGVRVSRKEVKDSPVLAFRGETLIKHPLTRILAVLVDNERRKEWVARLEKSVILERAGDYEFVVYQHFGLPPMFSDRDYVYRAKGLTDAKTGVVRLLIASETHPKAPETVGVRAHLVRSSYILTPQPDGKSTKVEVEILTDPKGWIPKWLVNQIQKSWPLKTLSRLRKQTAKDYVKDVALPPTG